jgi:hypothetical protein
MQNLFEFNQLTGMITLNRVWIGMVPEFKEILLKSKKCPGDADGRRKLHATRIFTFIYMLTDFKSPLRDMDEKEKYAEALRCSELTAEDIVDDVKVATAVYELYQENSARSLRTLKSMRKSLDQLDRYFTSVDFTKTDKKGELLHSAKEYQANMKGVSDTYKSYEEFEERVHKELAAEATVRGDRKLGGKEGKRTGWQEGKRPEATGVNMTELIHDIFGSTATLSGEGDDDLPEEGQSVDEQDDDPHSYDPDGI